MPSISESLVTEVIDGVERTFYVNPDTGGRKEVKLARPDLVPVFPYMELAEHYGRGALKYADRNWELGYPFSVSYAGLIRHVMQWWGGEERDAEMGSHHLTAVAWHAFALRQLVVTHPELDDRPHHAPGVYGVRHPEPADPMVTDLMNYMQHAVDCGCGDVTAPTCGAVDLSKPPLEADEYHVGQELIGSGSGTVVDCPAEMIDQILEGAWASPDGGVWFKDPSGRMVHATLPPVS